MKEPWREWQLFATEEAGGETVPDAGGQEEQEDFETLIRGRYKSDFDQRVQRILDGRLRGLRQENQRLRREAEERQRGALLAELAQRQRQEQQLRQAMDYAVRRTKQQLAQSIASGGRRVAENGGQRRSVSRTDPRALTGQELADIRRRVMDGEKIRF